MKVLHLFSNNQWTGPVEQVVNLCGALQERGVEVAIACAGGSRDIKSPIGERASERGVRTITPFGPGQSVGGRHSLRDMWGLRKCIESEKIDIVHAHTQTDHFLGGFAARYSWRRPVVLRTSYCSDGMVPSAANRILLARYTDGLITRSRTARARDIANFTLPAEKVWTVYGAIDTHRFSPRKEVPDIRSRFRLSEEHFVLEAPQRAQPGRTSDNLLEALVRASKQVSGLRLLAMGRGSHVEPVLFHQANLVRMENCVALPAQSGRDEYVGMVSALDARLFVAPFTDSTCGALLEAMALGKPCIVPERGVLTEIVTQGVDGLVVRDDSLAISGAIVRLASTPRLRRNLGANAREKIVRDFSLENQASLVDDLYRSLVALRPRKTKLRALLRARPTRK
jgi:glycosyltransferase involved in cell wall biosynthesis